MQYSDFLRFLRLAWVARGKTLVLHFPYTNQIHRVAHLHSISSSATLPHDFVLKRVPAALTWSHYPLYVHRSIRDYQISNDTQICDAEIHHARRFPYMNRRVISCLSNQNDQHFAVISCLFGCRAIPPSLTLKSFFPSAWLPCEAHGLVAEGWWSGYRHETCVISILPAWTLQLGSRFEFVTL